MRPSIWRARHERAIGPSTVAALILSALVGVLSIAPAAAENNGNENQNNGNQNHNNGHPNQGQNNNWQNQNHGNSGNHYGNNAYRPVYRQPYYYAQPVYVPPPVYDPQWQTPGINLIFPLDLR